MAKKKADTPDQLDAPDVPSTLDRLTELRYDIANESAVTRLLDILIDANGGDSTAVLADIESGRQSDSARESGTVVDGAVNPVDGLD